MIPEATRLRCPPRWDGHSAQLAHARCGVDGARLVERGDEAVLDRLAESCVAAREGLALVRGLIHGAVHGVREDGDEDGHAEQKAELARRVEHAGAGALDAAGYGAHAGGEQRRQREADAGADERAAPEHRAHGVGAREVPERHETGGRDERAGHRRQPGSDPVRQPAGDRREHEHGGRQDGDGEAGLELRVVHHRDHEDDEHERGAHQRRIHGHDRRARRGERAPPEEAQVEEGRGGAQLPPRPEGEERHRGGEQTEDDGRRPAPVVALDDRQGEAEEARGDQADAGPVERLGGAGFTATTHQGERQHDAQHTDRDVEPEHRRPAPALHEDAAEHGPGRGGGRAERSEQAGGEALPVLGERLQQQGQRRRYDGRGADRLHDAPRDERVDALGACAEQRSPGEEREPQHEEQLVPVAVRQPAHREEQDGEHEVVAVHHPRDRDHAALETADDQRHGDAHHRGVRQGEDDPGAEREDDQPGMEGPARGRARDQLRSGRRHVAECTWCARMASCR